MPLRIGCCNGPAPAGAVTSGRILMRIFFAVFLVAMAGSPAFACSFDTDCQPGSRCLKPSGSLYGYCMGGLYPGNSYARRPAYNPLDLTGRQGNTCNFNTDCGPGGVCVKSGGLYGTYL